MNYITEEKDLEQVFRLVNNYLDPGGLFLFDLNTIYKYREICGRADVSAENRRRGQLYLGELLLARRGAAQRIRSDPLSCGMRTIRTLCEESRNSMIQRGLCARCRCWQLLEMAGREAERVSALALPDTMKEATESSERIYIMARERGKKNKIENRKDDRNV